MMNVFALTKRVLSIVLLICIALPMSKCTQGLQTEEGLKSEKTTVYYMYSKLNSHVKQAGDLIEGMLNIISMIWPFLFFLLSLRFNKLNQKVSFKLLELLLSLVTAYALFLIIVLNEILYGGVIAGISIILYFFTTVFEVGWLLGEKWRSSKNINESPNIN